jgi:acetolactate synthase I/II/III large subunit
VHRFFRYKQWGTQLAPMSGSMGYGLPAAIAAKLKYPDRPVIAFAGDGCFQMTGAELATAVQYALPIIIIVINNAMYGTIRMHQERKYPGRSHATQLVNPDFAALAKSYGAEGVLVSTAEEFKTAIQDALASECPVLIEVPLSQDHIAPGVILSNITPMPEV